ncbi:ACP phosphodiesterase [Spongiactinospora gelatinilytica]|uniref:FMN dependent NADH:quinone oxidoreductase n=1 Tax=Spongiactinospora gelatinilytica TaxID=2666298 RepID=A0A2W2G1Q8_9ACTN|nr:NAD(P)H-dependent oxidoreductase [Spongiactinospora gelatinilytica]PZG41892.1 ACP phosphodiesterase [Spongiactinospora gelatinilytica]
MRLFRIDASIRVEGSVTREVADTVLSVWREAHSEGTLSRRDLRTDPVPASAWQSLAGSPAAPTHEADQARALAAKLADELIEADAYLFAVPLYNFGPSQHFKTWMDLVLTDLRLAPGVPGPLTGRPAVLVTARGGGYGPGTPRWGWDHSTPWLVRMLRDVFGLNLQVSEAELTLAEVNPALAPFRGLAAESLEAAHRSARRHGDFLAAQVAAGVA